VWQVTLSIQAGCAGPEPVGCVRNTNLTGLPAERLVDRQPMGTSILIYFIITGCLIILWQGLHILAQAVQVIRRQIYFQGVGPAVLSGLFPNNHEHYAGKHLAQPSYRSDPLAHLPADVPGEARHALAALFDNLHKCAGGYVWAVLQVCQTPLINPRGRQMPAATMRLFPFFQYRIIVATFVLLAGHDLAAAFRRIPIRGLSWLSFLSFCCALLRFLLQQQPGRQ